MSPRRFLVLIALAAVACFSSPSTRVSAQAGAAPVVISQVYGGGGNAGATLRHDFIELFNRSAGPVDVTGWSVQYASSAGSSWQRTDLGTLTLQPGQYYLVQEAVGAGGTADLPTPDAIGTIAMSASAGKVALVNAQVTLTGACPTTIVDFVGYGPATTCAETAPTTPNLTNTTAALRKIGGCQDTNSNLDDFANGTPTPHNTSAPLAPCSGPTPLSVTGGATPASVEAGDAVLITAAVTPATDPSSSGISVTADLTAIGGSPTSFLVDDGTSGDSVAGDNVFSLGTVVLPGTPIGARSLNVSATDLQSRTASNTFSLQVTAPLIVRLPHDVQGPGGASPFAGQIVTVQGVVTARKFNGFFVQSRDDEQDGDPLTSEGLFVFTSSAPPAQAVVAHRVRVTGTVSEFVPSADLNSRPLTEIGAGATVVDLGVDQLPSPVVLTAADVNPSGGLDVLERFEGMRVSIASLTVIAPTDGTVSEVNAIASNSGVFYAVVSGTPRPTREPGIPVSDPVPPCAGCAPPRFDENPERLRVDSDAILGTLPLAVQSGALIADVVGIVDYGFRTYTILPETTLTATGGLVATPVRAVAQGEYTVASFNMERFFDTTNDPATDDPVLTANAFANRLSKASQIIRDYLRLPDVLGLQEVENLTTLQAIAARVNADAGADGDYVAYLVEGNDPGGIDVGLLIRSSRVGVTSVEQVGKDVTYAQPDGTAALLNDRPPLVLRAMVHAAGFMPSPLIVVVNHLRSLNGVNEDPGDGPRVREKRRQQAEYVAMLLNGLQAEGPVVSVGDYNAFDVNDGYVDGLGTILGTPTPTSEVVLASPDLVTPNFLIAGAGEYSYLFDGNAQSLDHVLVSSAAAAQLTGLEHARVNADFPETLRGAVDPATGIIRPERLSDHDPAVAYFRLVADIIAPRIRSATPSTRILWPATGALVPVHIDVDATDNAGAPSCGVRSVASSEPVTGRGDTTSPDWIIDGPLDVRLRAERRLLGIGRLYVIGLTCTDAAGNSASEPTWVVVPRIWFPSFTF